MDDAINRLGATASTDRLMRCLAFWEQLDEVLQLVAKGKSNREIGRALHISTATVKTHLVRIFDKLGVTDRTVALERGIMRLEGGGP